jgi:undecaprenyl-diphosphatase
MTKKHAAWLAIAAGAAFLMLAIVVSHFPKEVAGVDAFFTHLVQPLQTELGAHIFYTISFFGSVAGVILAAFVLLLFSRKLTLGLPIAIALALSALAANGIKILVGRARPTPLQWLSPLHSYSFPSGHATSIMVVYGGIALYFLTHGRKRTRSLYATLAVLLIVLVGFSRIVLGYHFFSDVVGGYLLGLFWLGFTFWALPKHRIVIPTKRS